MMLARPTRCLAAPRCARPHLTLLVRRRVATSSTPPALVRHGLVGAVGAVGTPFFPVIGAVRLANHLVPQREARLVLLGSAAAIVSFAARDVVPFLIDHAELIAPLAACNGVVAAASYAALELAAGGPAALLAGTSLSTSPLVGAAVGAATAILAPYAYSTALDAWFGISVELRRACDRLLPVTVPTGVVAGAVLGPLLRPAVLGVPGVPWTTIAAPVGVVLAASAAAVYGRRAATFHLHEAAPLDLDALSEDDTHGSSKHAEATYVYLDARGRAAATALWRLEATAGRAVSSFDAQAASSSSSSGGPTATAFAVDDGAMAAKGEALRRFVAGPRDEASPQRGRVFLDRRAARLRAALDRCGF